MVPSTAFRPGDLVRIRQQPWHVERARVDADICRLDVSRGLSRTSFLVPFDRVQPLTRPRRFLRGRRQSLRARALGLPASTFGHRSLASGVGAWLDIRPFQLVAAIAFGDGHRRVLLADEVGLGKTVQAGLAIAEVVRDDAASRVLLLVPPGLHDQWADELTRRFGIQACTIDRRTLGDAFAASPAPDDPWRRPGVWLASLDFVKQPHVAQAVPDAAWDLVVLDEAHDACGHSERYRAADMLARRARRVLLLSATPHTGEPTRFARLLALGQLPVTGGDTLAVLRRTRTSLGQPHTRRVRWVSVRPSSPERDLFEALADFERQVLRTSRATRDAALLLLAVFRKRVLSTPQALRRSLERRLAWLDAGGAASTPDWAQPRLAFDDGNEDAEPDWAALAAVIGMDPRRERRWLLRLVNLASAVRAPAKLVRLIGLLARIGEPAVVFTEFVDSLTPLTARMSSVRPTAVMHGGQSLDERRASLAAFLDGRAAILLTTDVAAQGLNLHAGARWVISLELPWNPARLEQRIGRVDRIGQRRPVHATLLLSRHPLEAPILRRLAHRVVAARGAVADTLLDDFIPPGESAVARAVFVGADGPMVRAHTHPPTSGASSSLVESNRLVVNHGVPLSCWHRRAKAEARLLERRRLAARHWRASRPAMRRPRAPAGQHSDTCDAIALFDVSLLNGTGQVIEHQIIPLRIAWSVGVGGALARMPSPRSAQWLEGVARQCLMPKLRARVATLTRRDRSIADREVAVEEALERDLVASRRPPSAQAGLFDARETRARETWLASAHARRQALADRIAVIRHRHHIVIGPITLCLVLPRPANISFAGLYERSSVDARAGRPR